MAGWRTRIIGLTLCMITAAAAAQNADTAPLDRNPSLTALANGVRDERYARDIAIRRLDIAVEVRGAVAETSVTTAFSSNATERLQGEFKLQLPADAVITGYALDIEGKMVDGVLVDRAKAQAVYASKVRAKIDPGLAEVSNDNVFSTRIFPITPKNGRTVRVKFVSAAARDGTIRLPLITDAPTEGWSVAIHASGEAAPDVSLPDGKARFIPVADGFTATSGGKGALDGGLTIRTVMPDLLVSRHHSGERYLQMGGALPAAAPRAAEHLRIYWDRSRSRLDDRLDSEIALVRDYIDSAKPRVIELVAFNSSGARRATVANAESAATWLKGLTYRGATSFAAIADEQPIDRCLLFSDGRVTIDRDARFDPRCRVDTVTSAVGADRAWLGHVATAHGGRSLLLGTNRGKILDDLRAAGTGVTGVEGKEGPLAFVPIDSPAGRWRILALAPAAGDVTVRFADGSFIVSNVKGKEAAFDGEAALVGRDRLSLLSGTLQRPDFVALSRRYGIASPSLSFVVLERPEDYVEAEVAPPATYPKEDLDRYAALKVEADKAKDREKEDRLIEVVGIWNDEVKWWNTAFDPKARPKGKRGGGTGAPPPALVATPVPTPSPPSPVVVPTASADAARDEDNANIMVTARRVQNNVQSTATAVTTITSDDLAKVGDDRNGNDAGRIAIDAWQPDRPYIKAFDADPARFDAIFVKEEAKSGKIPAFYLDTAEWLRKHGRNDDAIEMVLGALELPTANEVTLGFVADRLERYGAIDRAIELRERHAALDPDRPQPKRYLALALAHRAALRPVTARADLQRAISLLRDVALTPWQSSWDGIEVISLVEANMMIPRLKAAGGVPDLDPRLIKLLDVDLRVTIDWTTDATDLDLWVDEPDGERSIYSNPLTAIGGQLSNDMTQGYGPEQYLLRRAPDGTYIVQSNVFASDQLDPNGASFLTAHLFRNYGRPNQTEEVVDVELVRGPKGGGNSEPRMIGRIVVGRK